MSAGALARDKRDKHGRFFREQYFQNALDSRIKFDFVWTKLAAKFAKSRRKSRRKSCRKSRRKSRHKS